MNREERSFVSLVARGGCVDLRALRRALVRTRLVQNPKLRKRLILYFYLKDIDPDHDEPMMDIDED